MNRTVLSIIFFGFSIALCIPGCRRESPPPTPRQSVDLVLPVETETFEAIVPRNATLETIFEQHELSPDAVQTAIASVRTVFDPRQFRAGRPYRLVRSLEGSLREFEYQVDMDRFLRVVNHDRSQPLALEAQLLPYDKEVATLAVRGYIDSEHPSLVAAMDETGERIELAIALAEIFGGSIDFENDLQPGDSFEVLFEKTTYEGQFAGYRAIKAATFMNEGRVHHAYLWAHPVTAKTGYYDEQGRSLKRLVLASPLPFTPRVTSGFSRRRLHPVHRTHRPHLGVDYAAPAGARVVSVASGVVVSAGWAGGGGRQVRIRHGGGLESYYLHLSAFAKGIRSGARVDQGQLIGRVGSSGTATGPHLDYRLRRNGVFVDPRREHARQPPGEPIPSALLADFQVSREAIAKQLVAGLPAAPGARGQVPVAR
jgi:murein DD-endopeptidase MepM/ murein hydrolase activator NlpD